MHQSDYETSECLADFCFFDFHVGLLGRTLIGSLWGLMVFLLLIFLLVELAFLHLPVGAVGQSMGRVVLAPLLFLHILPALAELPPAINSSEAQRYPQQHHHNR